VRLPTLILLLILVIIPISAQDTTNVSDRLRFNGIWVFDSEKSEMAPILKEIRKGETLEIVFAGPELRIVKAQTRNGRTKSVTLLFYGDNREEKNQPFPFNEQLEIVSHSAWEKNVLVRHYVTKSTSLGRQLEKSLVRKPM
jgi:hypothetical protein